MREMHPLRSIFIYILAVMVLYLVALHVTHVVLGRLDDLPVVYQRLPYGLAFFTAFSIVGILMMRVAHFIGLRTLLDLVIGTYHRPVRGTESAAVSRHQRLDRAQPSGSAR